MTRLGNTNPGTVNELIEGLVISRTTGDRRVGASAPAPYISEEGLVLIDRRESLDRRASSASPRLL